MTGVHLDLDLAVAHVFGLRAHVLIAQLFSPTECEELRLTQELKQRSFIITTISTVFISKKTHMVTRILTEDVPTRKEIRSKVLFNFKTLFRRLLKSLRSSVMSLITL